jgi:hypothetical protein
MFSKDHILKEIRRTAEENGGDPLGQDRFAAETGIRIYDWFGVHWARWGEALREAGLKPNKLNGATDEKHLLASLSSLALTLGRLPSDGDLRLKRRRDDSFPCSKTFGKLGNRRERISHLKEYCLSTPRLDAVVELCNQYLSEHKANKEPAQKTPVNGYVYLLKHGARREYKIGRSTNILRREGQIAVELPEKVQPIHVIQTNDPAGIEAYWHKRFESKRKNGEWFDLDRDDVAAFRRRRFM